MKIFYTSSYIVKKNTSKPLFWTVFIWPITLLMGLEVIITEKDIQTFGLIMKEGLFSIGIPLYALIAVVFFSQMIAREFFIGKSERILEFLIAMSNYKTQFYGRLLGTSMIVLISNLFYVAIIVIFKEKLSQIGKLLRQFSFLDTKRFLEFLIALSLFSIFVILFSALVGIETRDVSKISQHLGSVYLLIVSAPIINLISNDFIQKKVLLYVPFFNIPSIDLQTSLTDILIIFGTNIFTLIVFVIGLQRLFKKRVEVQ
ncbi:hypothetical protein A3O11_04310 [Ligilactobacillus aviarius]|uniref:hypothetical protein n=1 Tax=Ligilactobacillus aviarius TaxID=1606 RepID=UPI0007D8E24A|nr:hypothetical protein [Ligilactobacillus aviarius]OAQ02220.1 hypothetical protein A3O10_01340 [Ligilactobacillus aviarius]OAQ05217.1 hypothetical protein A3O11_04310 [Ligilactobacillus aviarius]OAS77970.1 hypothetical protein A3O18_07225 [Ligilactobacillus aviarius]PEG71622.1 hypothetical protein A3P04_00930 [Ligilactobacillus aviarius]PEG73756.1 hypothetical protein A3O82_03765 [Ligilactobacillus aviarius]